MWLMCATLKINPCLLKLINVYVFCRAATNNYYLFILLMNWSIMWATTYQKAIKNAYHNFLKHQMSFFCPTNSPKYIKFTINRTTKDKEKQNIITFENLKFNGCNSSLLQRAGGEIRSVDWYTALPEERMEVWRWLSAAHRPGGGRGNGTVAEDWRHQRKRLSFRAWNKDLTQTLPALFHFNPSTLTTSLLTLNCYLWSTVWSFLPTRAQTKTLPGFNQSGK